MILKLLKELIPYISSYKSKIFGSVFLSLMLVGIKFSQAYLVKPIFDKGLSPESDFETVLRLSGILLLLGLINFPCRFFHFYWIRYVVDNATCGVRDNIYKKLQRLPTSYYAKTKQGHLISNILNDTHTFSLGFRSAVDLIREPLLALAMFGLALYRDWQLTLIIVVAAPLFIIIFSLSGKKVRKNQGQVQEDMSELTHTIAEGISAHKITKAFNLQTYVKKRFEKAQTGFFNSQMKTTFVEEFAHPLVELVGAFAFSGVIVFAHHKITSGEMTTGDFISFVTALALLMDPIRKFSQANMKMNQASAAAERVFKLLDLPEEEVDREHKIEGFKNKIEVKDLTFSYGDGEVIRNMNLEIVKGEKVALVGLSGSGKSTLINLLMGLYPIESGDILIDGISIKKINLISLRNIFGLVSQDIFLFHDTIHENLSLGNKQDQKSLDTALKIAYATEFINDLPDGVETIIGERGARLSGGQQQRITIARAFLKNPDILLFDEATSSLDNESEKVVQKALDEIAGDKTVIAVAHRLTTVQDYDKIFVLKEGRVIENGKHQQLIDKNGEYAKLYQLSMQ